MHPEMIVYTAVVPRLQASAFCGKELTPSGVQTAVLQIAVSNIRNLLPSARNATKTAGRSNPGQKKEAGNGLNTKRNDVS